MSVVVRTVRIVQTVLTEFFIGHVLGILTQIRRADVNVTDVGLDPDALADLYATEMTSYV